MLEVTIDRKRWLRGEGGDESYLLRAKDNKMCCIGFVCRQLGFSEDNLISLQIASEVSDHKGNFRLYDPLLDHIIMTPVYTTNDNEDLTDSEREEALIALGRQTLDINFIFVD